MFALLEYPIESVFFYYKAFVRATVTANYKKKRKRSSGPKKILHKRSAEAFFRAGFPLGAFFVVLQFG